MEVGVEDDDVTRARSVGLARDGSRDLDVLDEAPDDDVLAGLDVRADPDGQLRVPPQTFARRSRA